MFSFAEYEIFPQQTHGIWAKNDYILAFVHFAFLIYLLIQQKSPKCSTWMQSQKRHNDLCLFQGKPFNITVLQAYAPTSNAEEAEVEWFYEDLQDLLQVTPQKRCPFHYRGLECKNRKSRNTWSNRQIWPWSTE